MILKNFSWKRLTTLCSVLLSACLISCGDTKSSPENESEQVLRVNIGNEPPSLDPRKVGDSVSHFVVAHLYEGLTRKGADGQMNLAQAKSIEQSEDGCRYIIHLRECYWSNGEKVEAEDFAYSWESLLTPGFDSGRGYYLYPIKNAEKVHQGLLPASFLGICCPDSETIVVDLEHPVPYFMGLLGHANYFPVYRKKAKLGKDALEDEEVISNGPFRLQHWAHYDALLLEKNPNYWDAQNVFLSSMETLMIDDSNTELRLFSTGGLDWAGSPISHIPSDALPSLKDLGATFSNKMVGSYWYVFNNQEVPFQSPKIRRAFSYAINRQEIVENVLQDGQLAAAGIVPPFVSGRRLPLFEDWKVQKAQRLFQEGLKEMELAPSEVPPITLLIPCSRECEKIAQAIQQQWKETLGVLVEIRTLEWKVFLDALRSHEFQIARAGWVPIIDDPADYLQMFEEAHWPNNFGMWNSESYTNLLQLSYWEQDPVSRRELLLSAEEILIAEMPVAPIFFLGRQSYLKNPLLKGAQVDPLGKVSFIHAKFSK